MVVALLFNVALSFKECFIRLEDRTRPRPSEYQADAHSIELPSPVLSVAYICWNGIIQSVCFEKWPHRDFIQLCFRDSNEVVDLLGFCKILIFYVSCGRSTLNESYNRSVYILEAKLCRAHFRFFKETCRALRNKPYMTSGPGSGLAGHLLLHHKPTHPLSVDLFFYNIKYF